MSSGGSPGETPPTSLTPFTAQAAPGGPDGTQRPSPTHPSPCSTRSRGEFLVRVYQHLLAALLAFVAFEALLINLGAAESLYDVLFDSGGRWILLLGGFMVVSWLATNAAHDILNRSRQYAGLFGTGRRRGRDLRALPPLLLRGPGRRHHDRAGGGRHHRPRVRRTPAPSHW